MVAWRGGNNDVTIFDQPAVGRGVRLRIRDRGDRFGRYERERHAENSRAESEDDAESELRNVAAPEAGRKSNAERSAAIRATGSDREVVR